MQQASGGGGGGAAAIPVTRTAPRRTPLGSPALLPVPGAEATDAYGAALSGSPEPLGATYDFELVRAPSRVWCRVLCRAVCAVVGKEALPCCLVADRIGAG